MRRDCPSYNIDTLCRLFGNSRQAYYERTRYVCVKKTQEEVILSLVADVRKDFPRMGTRKMLIFLASKFEAMGLHIGRDAFFDLLVLCTKYAVLNQKNLLVRIPRKRRKTTYSDHWMHKYPNLIIGFTPDAPNRLWVCDITYVDIEGGSSYLFLITDAYSHVCCAKCKHKIVGWCLAKTLQASGALAALRMALKDQKGSLTGLIHHSDRGSQYLYCVRSTRYCCGIYVNMLTRHKIQISMTQNGNPRENAIAERINGILKTEWIYGKKPCSWKETIAFVGKIIDLYNNQRPHSSISYMTPAQIHQTGAKTERKWKNYYLYCVRSTRYSKKKVSNDNNDVE